MNDDEKDCCNVLLLGSTGAGKSSLANFLFNPLDSPDVPFEVPASDSIHSCTNQITQHVYKVSEDGPALRIIDTPGMFDSRTHRDNPNQDHILSLVQLLLNLKSLHFVLICIRWEEYVDSNHHASLEYYRDLLQPLIVRGAVGLVLTKVSQSEYEQHIYDQSLEQKKFNWISTVNSVFRSAIDVCEIFGITAIPFKRDAYIQRIHDKRLRSDECILDQSYFARIRLLRIMLNAKAVPLMQHKFPLPPDIKAKVKPRLNALVETVEKIVYSLSVENPSLKSHLQTLVQLRSESALLYAKLQELRFILTSMDQVIQLKHSYYASHDDMKDFCCQKRVSLVVPSTAVPTWTGWNTRVITNKPEVQQDDNLKYDMIIEPECWANPPHRTYENDEFSLWYCRLWFECDGSQLYTSEIRLLKTKIHLFEQELHSKSLEIEKLEHEGLATSATLGSHQTALRKLNNDIELLRAGYYTFEEFSNVMEQCSSTTLS